MPQRFKLPKKFAKPSTGKTYSRVVKDMIIDGTPKFEAWFVKINKELIPTRSGTKIKVTTEAIEAGLVDFEGLAAETRKKMETSFKKGQKLGIRRTANKRDRAGQRRQHRSKADSTTLPALCWGRCCSRKS